MGRFTATGHGMESMTRQSHESDEALILSLAEGDDQALSRLIDRHGPAVYRFALRWTGDLSMAEDVSQEVFFRVYSHAGRFAAGMPFKPWLYAIARNACVDLSRSRAHRVLGWFANPLWGDSQDTTPDDTPSDVPDQADQLERRQEEARLRKALLRLPEKQRAAVILKHFQDLSLNEIASAMGTSVSAVESLLVRAKRNLAKTLLG